MRTWYSKVPKKVEGNVKGFELEGDHHPVMIAAYNKESGIMINYWALAAADGNIKAHKAHASDMSAGAQKAMQGACLVNPTVYVNAKSMQVRMGKR